jgi:hypothetical protein
VIDPDNGDRARVVRPIAAAAFAVVIRRIGVEASTGIVRIAFGFFGSFRRRFFFDSGLFRLFLACQRPLFSFLSLVRSLLAGGDVPGSPLCGFAARLRLGSMIANGLPMGCEAIRLLSRGLQLGFYFPGVAARATANSREGDCQDSRNSNHGCDTFLQHWTPPERWTGAQGYVLQSAQINTEK